MKNIKLLFYIISIAILSSCIKNDIPYPHEVEYVNAISFDGEIQEAIIDKSDFTIRLELSEDVDISAVKLKKLEISQETKANINVGDKLNLTKPFNLIISKYQEYIWRIIAHQNIERYIKIQNQVGEPLIDIDTKSITLYTNEKSNLQEIIIDEIKLARKGIEQSTEFHQKWIGIALDFSSPRSMTINNGKEMETWTISVVQTKDKVKTISANGHTRVAYLYGEILEKGTEQASFEYRKVGEENWIAIDNSKIELDENKFSCRLNTLEPNTNYEFRATLGDEKGATKEFATVEEEPLPDGLFDDWHKSSSVWNPWAEGKNKYWDTSNPGGAAFIGSNVEPSNDLPTGISTGKSVKLSSKSAFITLAAGSIYLGNYKRTDGTNGVLGFGREYKSYPTRLKGYYKYTSGSINFAKDPYSNLKGKADTAYIYAVLTDLDEEMEIRTNPSNRSLVDLNAKYVIAYAQLTKGESMDNWEEFDIPFKYVDTKRRPKRLILVVTSSKYGDYFTGSSSSVLHIDNFRFEFD